MGRAQENKKRASPDALGYNIMKNTQNHHSRCLCVKIVIGYYPCVKVFLE
jgi:hypothetical protein